MISSLFDHLAWADARTLDALRAMPTETAAAEQARTIYAHLAAAEHVWLARLEGRTPAHPVWPALDVDTAAALAAESAAGLRAHAGGDAAALARRVAYRNSAGHAFTETVGEILAHVAMHGSYHRGQLALLARQGGGVPASTDFVTFVRDAVADPTRALVDRYLAAYNAFDVAGMLATLHPDVTFENVAGGQVTASARGRDEFRALAEHAATLFTSRRQSIARYEATADGARVAIAYEGVLAADLGPELRAGATLRLEGASTFGVRDGLIARIVDES